MRLHPRTLVGTGCKGVPKGVSKGVRRHRVQGYNSAVQFSIEFTSKVPLYDSKMPLYDFKVPLYNAKVPL